MRQRRGFTLIELSIVLVVIGLLVGGILTAQSMISTAKIGTQVRQIQQLDVALSNFKARYDQIPGDSNLFDPPGDNDGKIYGLFPESPNSSNWLVGEISSVWKHLHDGGMLEKNYQMADLSPIPNPADFFPMAKIGTSLTGINLVTVPAVAWNRNFIGETIYNLMYFASGVNGDFYTSLTVAEAASVDSKMDDGISNTGNVQAAGPDSPGNFPTTGPSGCIVDTTGYAYNFSSTAATPCALNIKALSQTGQRM